MGTSLNPDVNVAKYKTEAVGGVTEMELKVMIASDEIIRSPIFYLILVILIAF